MTTVISNIPSERPSLFGDEGDEGQGENMAGRPSDSGVPRMTPEYLCKLCRDAGGYLTPELNEKLYLHFKGFGKIENLDAYTGCRAIWLEGNALSSLAGLERLIELRCLFAHQNALEQIAHLDTLTNLDTLNVSHNFISRISGLECLAQLNTLNITHNRLDSVDSLIHLVDNCPLLAVLDLSHNRIADPAVLELVFKRMPSLGVLVLTGNPVIRAIERYRKRMVSELATLKYLDDRPVFDDERRYAMAWARGGPDAERAERDAVIAEERARREQSFLAMEHMRDEALRARGIDPDEARAQREAGVQLTGEALRQYETFITETERFNSATDVPADLTADARERLIRQTRQRVMTKIQTPSVSVPLRSPHWDDETDEPAAPEPAPADGAPAAAAAAAAMRPEQESAAMPELEAVLDDSYKEDDDELWARPVARPGAAPSAQPERGAQGGIRIADATEDNDQDDDAGAAASAERERRREVLEIANTRSSLLIANADTGAPAPAPAPASEAAVSAAAMLRRKVIIEEIGISPAPASSAADAEDMERLD